MRRFQLRDVNLESTLSRARYGDVSEEGRIWYGSGRFFSLEMQFPEVSEETAKEFRRGLDRLVNFDSPQVCCERYRGLFIVETQPMSLAYHENRMPWKQLLEFFRECLGDMLGLVVRVDQRSLGGAAEEEASEFLRREWENFAEFCSRVGLEVGLCAVSMIECNLEFRIFRSVRTWEQLLQMFRLVDAVCEVDGGTNWSMVESRM